MKKKIQTDGFPSSIPHEQSGLKEFTEIDDIESEEIIVDSEIKEVRKDINKALEKLDQAESEI